MESDLFDPRILSVRVENERGQYRFTFQAPTAPCRGDIIELQNERSPTHEYFIVREVVWSLGRLRDETGV